VAAPDAADAPAAAAEAVPQLMDLDAFPIIDNQV
jgi:hypothetical protein